MSQNSKDTKQPAPVTLPPPNVKEDPLITEQQQQLSPVKSNFMSSVNSNGPSLSASPDSTTGSHPSGGGYFASRIQTPAQEEGEFEDLSQYFSGQREFDRNSNQYQYQYQQQQQQWPYSVNGGAIPNTMSYNDDDYNAFQSQQIYNNVNPFWYLFNDSYDSNSSPSIDWSNHPLWVHFYPIIRSYLNRRGYRDGVRRYQGQQPQHQQFQ